MQHITVSKVKAACRAAYAGKILLAQNRQYDDDNDDSLIYGYGGDHTGGFVCAIGAALDPNTIDHIDSENLHSALVELLVTEHGILTVESSEDIAVLMAIQSAHDTWLNDGSLSSLDEKKFVRLIQE